MQRRLFQTTLIASALALAGLAAHAQGKDIKIAVIAGKTGPLEAYAKQTISRLHAGPRIRHRRHDDGGRPQAAW